MPASEWAPVESFDETWPYLWKWGYSADKDQAHAWRIGDNERDGTLTHRQEFEQTFGHPAKTLQGDQLGVASYIPEERKIDGTLVAPPEIQLHTFYGQKPHDRVYEWFLTKFPDVLGRQAVVSPKNEKRSSEQPVRWTWSQNGGLELGVKNFNPKSFTGHIQIRPNYIQIIADRPEMPRHGLAAVKAELAKQYPKADIRLPEIPGARSVRPGYLDRQENEVRRMAAVKWANDTLHTYGDHGPSEAPARFAPGEHVRFYDGSGVIVGEPVNSYEGPAYYVDTYDENGPRGVELWAAGLLQRPKSYDEPGESTMEDWLGIPPAGEDYYRKSKRSFFQRLRRKAADGPDMDGAMVALFIPTEVGNTLKIRGGETADNMHVTLAYFVEKAADRDDWEKIAEIVETIANQTAPLIGKVGGYGIFQNDDDPDVLWASPNLPGLEDLRQKVVEACEAAGFHVSDQHGWIPHVTIKYDFKGKLPRVPEENELAIRQLSFARGTDKQHFDLKGDFVKETSWEMTEWRWPGTQRFVTDGKETLLEPEDKGEWHAPDLDTLHQRFQSYYPDSKQLPASGWVIPTQDGTGYGIWAPKIGYGGNEELGLHDLVNTLDRELKKPTHLVEDWRQITDPKLYVSTHPD